MKTFLQSLRMLCVLSLLTGVLYPLAVTGVAQLAFPQAANGSLVKKDGRIAGSALLAQKTENPRYFWSRPSGADYATMPSGASNLSSTSEKLRVDVAARATRLREAHHLAPDTPVPADLLFASGSGLDPHISPAAAAFQTERVAAARGVSPGLVTALVHQTTADGGLLGETRVNVLLLNLALDHAAP